MSSPAAGNHDRHARNDSRDRRQRPRDAVLVSVNLGGENLTIDGLPDDEVC
jgi:hypothetical protein